ncbi:MAG: energy-coupling factor transport system ATP-binding protein [Petroclostridium sp.]|jgi:energy-coupling factor transport system ATP-binding protein|uniref:energy-coupling factor transporter ATPase n=1 Tax=Petroclostridium xylanilyticum TaxID=1792311 RepID=UPI000B983D2D|nr:energy-coupling factor transporter ATPase [Petroclostridium xylanilyticum]MBZ4645199.1 energy-coupling factor transporter ATPase [Clostridia bacterium]MDK2809733.1 energy-coupling factor transport system ATP-binding protein [Petroclostridium sp.]
MSIKIENLNYIYMPGSPFEKQALRNVSLEIKKGEFIGLIGHTGSGKSTLVQHLNGLLRPTGGKIYINDIEITKKKVNLKEIRSKVGLVFQYPEHQLFEETVYKDIAFGPANMDLTEDEIQKRVHEALNIVGLSSSILDKSPFELSGGQKRRVAIAGVLAMKPEILVLDEPTAGLDPAGRDEILFQIKALHTKLGMTVILVSHSMEDIARLVDRIIVMHKGCVAMTGTPGEVFKRGEELETMGLSIPQITHVINKLRREGIKIRDDIFTVHQAKKELLRLLGSAGCKTEEAK